MQIRTKVSIVTVVGAGALLLCALAAIIAFRSQVANASVNPPHGDHGPYVGVALVDTTVAPGEYLGVGALFHGMPCTQGTGQDNDQGLCNYVDKFADGLGYEYEVLDSSGASTESCKFSGSGNGKISRTLSGSYRHWKTLGPGSYRISSDCEPGPYKIRLTLMHSSCPNLNDYGQDACIDTESFEVSDSTSTGGGNQGGGNQGGGNQGGGNQGGGNQGGGNQGGGNQGGGNQGGGNQGGGNQGGGNQGGGNQGGGNQGGGNQGGGNQGGGNQGGGNQGGGNPTATPTATATTTPTITATATPTVEGNDGNGGDDGNPTATPTATATSELQQRQQQIETVPTATPTATRQQGGNNQGNNQGRSNNNGGNNGGNVQTFIESPSTPPPASSPQQSQTPLAITVPEIMNVRTGPGLTYDIVTTVPAGTQATIVGIDPDNEWYQVEIDGIEGQVWIYQGLTTLQGSLTGVKQYTALEITQLTGTPGSDGSVPLAITVPITMNVRTGPGLTYDVVRVVPKGTQGRIFGIDPDDDWFQIELEGLDTLVWVYQDLTTVIGSLAGVKWVTEAEIAMLPAAITQPAILNARAGPGLTYDILTTVPQGTWTKITGIDTLGDWYRVELDDLDQPAWIFRDYTKVAGGSLSGLIQIAVGGTPSPTVGQLTSSITVLLSLPQAGGVDLDVSWLDASACAQLYNLYHRSSTDSTTYISLEQAATASTVNSKSSEFQHPEREQLHLGLVRDDGSRP